MPSSTVIKLTYVEITDSRKILLCKMGSHSRPFQRDITQDGHCWEENTKTAAFPLTGIPCALTPYMRNTTKKILIADDNDACRESLGVSIKGLGYEVFEAATGQETIDKASSIHPDLIMMDLRLPGMNGDEATVRLKRNLSTRNIPVLISTAWTTACNVGDRVDRALEAGADEILYKPFHLPMLRDVLRAYLLASGNGTVYE